jgi:hypothetical protein
MLASEGALRVILGGLSGTSRKLDGRVFARRLLDNVAAGRLRRRGFLPCWDNDLALMLGVRSDRMTGMGRLAYERLRSTLARSSSSCTEPGCSRLFGLLVRMVGSSVVGDSTCFSDREGSTINVYEGERYEEERGQGSFLWTICNNLNYGSLGAQRN